MAQLFWAIFSGAEKGEDSPCSIPFHSKGHLLNYWFLIWVFTDMLFKATEEIFRVRHAMAYYRKYETLTANHKVKANLLERKMLSAPLPILNIYQFGFTPLPVKFIWDLAKKPRWVCLGYTVAGWGEGEKGRKGEVWTWYLSLAVFKSNSVNCKFVSLLLSDASCSNL